MSVYIEYLTFRSLLSILWEGLLLYFIGNKEIKTHYYIDASLLGGKIGNNLNKISRCRFKKLEFMMKDIKDENGDHIKHRIEGKELINIQRDVIYSDAYYKLRHSSWDKNRVESYLQKGLIDGSIRYNYTVSRIIFIINVCFHISYFIVILYNNLIHWKHLVYLGIIIPIFYDDIQLLHWYSGNYRQ